MQIIVLMSTLLCWQTEGWIPAANNEGCKNSLNTRTGGCCRNDTSILDVLARDSFQSDWLRETYDAVAEQYLNSLQGDQLTDTLNAQSLSVELTILNYCIDSSRQYREERISLIGDVAVPLTRAFNPGQMKIIEVSGENLPVCVIYLENKKGSYVVKYRLTLNGWEKIKEKTASGPMDLSPLLDTKVDLDTDLVWDGESIMVTAFYAGTFFVQPVFLVTSRQIEFLENLLN